MFDSDLEREAAVNLRRRAFLGASAAAVAGAAAWFCGSRRRSRQLSRRAMRVLKESEVTIVQFPMQGNSAKSARCLRSQER